MSERQILDIENVQELLNRNDEIIRKIRDVNEEDKRAHGKQKYACTVTYGCQMNEHDSEKLNAMLMEMGYLSTDAFEKADLIIFNTCCVRENAELKVYGNLGHIKHIKESKPDLILAVCGCMMQQPHIVEEIKKQYKYVDLVFGTHNIQNFPALLEETMNKHQQVVEVWDSEGMIIEGMPIERKFDVKAYVNIMFGCNNFCSYCIVPYTRGRERSRRPEDILDEVKLLVEGGVKEIMVLGQNVNSYGNTFDSEYDFSDLLREINAIEGIERIRFMTSHPKDISEKLLVTMSECEHICEYLHLPVQSGSNAVLKKMNRKYTREKYLETVRRAKELIPELTLSTDIIVGFPGETDEDFEDTLDLVKQVGYDSAFTFIYSMRTGTPAATYDNQVPETVKHERFDRLLKTINPVIKSKIKAMQDEVVEVLVEKPAKNTEGYMMGRTRRNHTVTFPGDSSMVGKLVKVKITNPKTFSLSGEVVE